MNAEPTDTITAELRADILGGRYSPGERLVELRLTDRYKCGRAVARAALAELVKEGLVDREANRGATVRKISVAEAIEITEARAALESLIASHAARNATADDRAELAAVIENMEAAVAADDTTTYSGLNSLLHRRVREISGHAVGAELVQNLRNRASHHQYRLAMMPGRAEQSLGQHAAIVEAIAAGDEAEAAAAMDSHLRSVIEVLGRWRDAVPYG